MIHGNSLDTPKPTLRTVYGKGINDPVGPGEMDVTGPDNPTSWAIPSEFGWVPTLQNCKPSELITSHFLEREGCSRWTSGKSGSTGSGGAG